MTIMPDQYLKIFSRLLKIYRYFLIVLDFCKFFIQ